MTTTMIFVIRLLLYFVIFVTIIYKREKNKTTKFTLAISDIYLMITKDTK